MDLHHCSAKFPDVESGRGYFTAIEFLANWDVIGGYENGKFGPDDPVRASSSRRYWPGQWSSRSPEPKCALPRC